MCISPLVVASDFEQAWQHASTAGVAEPFGCVGLPTASQAVLLLAVAASNGSHL